MFEPYPCLRRVIVNTKTGAAFIGVVWRKRRDYLILRNAQKLQPGGGTLNMDGELMFESANIDFLQVVG